MKNYGLIDLDELEKEKAKWQKRADAQPDNDKGTWQLFDIRIGQIEEIQKMTSSLPSAQQVFEAGREGSVKKVPVVIDQYGGVNIEEHFVADKYSTADDFINQYKEKK